ncbi:hypothetical protein [Bacillus xiapuensis]|uniref:hypothetical protein n=1 Tax=Bacillus xiapuensis TaxID=2014075 RepID=UPI001E38951A|nr:hypothetical protein [Bacillus xiapuensis]
MAIDVEERTIAVNSGITVSAIIAPMIQVPSAAHPKSQVVAAMFVEFRKISKFLMIYVLTVSAALVRMTLILTYHKQALA